MSASAHLPTQELLKKPAFSQVIVVSGCRTVFDVRSGRR
jgi:hypothetical protein